MKKKHFRQWILSNKFMLQVYLYIVYGSSEAQAVRHSPPTARVLSSYLGCSMWVSWWMKWSLGRFFLGFCQFSPAINIVPPFLHTHFFPFHFNHLCDDMSGMVSQHLCQSQTFNKGASSHLILRPGPWVENELRIY